MPELTHYDVFALLPEKKSRWKQFTFSTLTHSVLTLIFLWVLAFHTQAPAPAAKNYHFVRLVESPHEISHMPAPTPRAKLPVEEAQLKVPNLETIKVPAALRPKPPVERAPLPPQIQVASEAVRLPVPQPAIPKQPVMTNVFSTGSSQPATIARAPEKVQTGGFGDPNGVPSHDSDKGKPVNIASAGLFDLPTGPGRGNGTGGKQGTTGVVASSGFGDNVATGKGRSGPSTASLKQSGFGDFQTASANQPRKTRSDVAPMQPAEILSKPVPQYTDEARKLHIEGEVLVEVVFERSGAIEVVRVVRGLGHGLDERAVQAAKQIRFKPASRDGQPADSRGILHILFQLA